MKGSFMADEIKFSTEQIAKALKALHGFEATEKGFPHLGDALKPAAQAYKNYQGLVGEAEEYLRHYDTLRAGEHIELKNGAIALKSGVTDTAAHDAFRAFQAAEQKLAVVPQESAKHLDALSSRLGGWFGEVHSKGGFTGKGVVAAVKNNLALVEGNKLKAFGRAGAAVGAIGLVGDGLFRSKTDDGEDRSLIVRGAEIGIFAAGAALALIAGKAKLSSLAAAVK
jgi:hypothetical protein